MKMRQINRNDGLTVCVPYLTLPLMPGPVRKENQFKLPDDFSGLDFTIPSCMRHLPTYLLTRVRFSLPFSSLISQHRQTTVHPASRASLSLFCLSFITCAVKKALLARRVNAVPQSEKFFTRRGRSKKFQHFCSQR